MGVGGMQSEVKLQSSKNRLATMVTSILQIWYYTSCNYGSLHLAISGDKKHDRASAFIFREG